MRVILMISILLYWGTWNLPLGQAQQEVKLRKRVELYYSHFSDGQYDLMWEMSSKSFRGRNENSKEKYVQYIQKVLPMKEMEMKTQIKDIKIDVSQSTVTMIICMRPKRSQEWMQVVAEDTWVLENGNWYLELYSERESAKGCLICKPN
jgi:hypothetical protein